MKSVPCSKCGGTGKEIDQHALAKSLRDRRKKRGLSLRQVAAKMGISGPYLSDLERGNRNWDGEKVKSFQNAIE